MTRDETTRIMAVLRAAYPRYYQGCDRAELDAIVSLWHEMLADVPYPTCAAAVKRLIAGDERGFPPGIGQIRAQLAALRQPQLRNEQQAWALAAKAARDGAYHAQERFAGLPPDVQAAVGSPRQLRDWALLDENELHTVAASNFQRSYRQVQKSQSEAARLPPALQNAPAIGGGMA